MKIKVKVKQAGRKRALLDVREIEIGDVGAKPSLADLLGAVVAAQVEEYNRKTPEKNLLPFLAEDEIENLSVTGKIGFGSVYNENKADLAGARETALQAFEDGLFSVFAGETEIRNLADEVSLDDAAVITFIRLTFLAGGYR